MRKVHEKVEVVVIGSGAAGSVYAAALAEAGKSVLVLERGVERKPEDLYSSQIWARRLKWGSHHVIEEGPDSIWHNFNAGHGFGGAAIHHYGVWPRYHEEDFTLQSAHGWGLDWPLSYNDLRPYYDRVQEDVGISGDAEAEIWRPAGAPYPLPPVPSMEHGRTLARGFAARGLHTAPIPIAVLSRPYKGRPACIWDAWCDAGCPTGSIANPLAVYLPRAKNSGAAMKGFAHVTRILTTDDGTKATGVEYVDANGEVNIQPADAVALCAFTVENVRVLLNSANDKHPDGLGNASGTVGRYLMTHPAVTIYGLFNNETHNFMGATGGQLICQDHYGKRSDPDGAFGSRQWEIGLGIKPNDLLGIATSRQDKFGANLEPFMRDAAKHMGCMVGVCEDEPRFENRIDLASTKDRFGMRQAKVWYRTSDDGKKLWRAAAKEGIEIFKAAGAREAWHSPPAGQHLMGGTIMGSDPKRSVVNRFSQSHEIPNLFVGGPGVFPTSSSINSTFTVHAAAMMGAEHLIKNWSSLT